MRHVRRSILAVLLLGLTTIPAAAQEWGRGWLERLSGPGPFSGKDYGFSVGCFTERGTDQGFSFFRSPESSTVLSCIDLTFSDYANEESSRSQQGLVTLARAEALFMWLPPLQARGGVEVGAGLGTMTFRGDGFDFGRFYVPVRLVVKPFRFFIRDNRHRKETGILQLVYSVLIVPDALRQENFNIPGLSFEPDHVLYPGAKIGIVVDFSSYLFNR
jgi:hypothetical protein